MSRNECRDCDAPIEWIETDTGKWIPVNPGRGKKRHVCQLDQLCEVCEKMFKGANWMTVCSDCYRNRPKPDSRPRPEPPPRETLKPTNDNDDPF